MKAQLLYLFSLAGLIMFGGCAVGPNYKRPAINSPASLRFDNAATNVVSPELAWWQVYKDKTLQALIREAFTNNYEHPHRRDSR
jgi:multidrug efflux system outer membrane protein